MKDDTISRAAALDALGERPMLWVDDDNYTLGARNQYDSNRLAIETVPSADAVPVVRCKDCKWWRDTDHTCKEHSLVSPMTAEEYCSRGERKGR